MSFSVNLRGLLVATGLLLGGAATASAEGEKIPLDQVPKAVLDAVKAKFPKGELTGAEKDTDGKKTTYEVKLNHEKRKFEVVATPEGKILAVEKRIEPSELPRPVTASLDAKYPKATIKKAEEVTADEKITYEVVLTTLEKTTVKLMFDPQGKLLESE